VTRTLAWRCRTVGVSSRWFSAARAAPKLVEESCRPQGHLAQSPSGGLWHAGGLHEVHAVEGLLVTRVLVARRCSFLAQH
jgi:hypothetical protein